MSATPEKYSRRNFIIRSPEIRRTIIGAVLDAPTGAAVTIRESTRSLEQNALLWALLQPISVQAWHAGRYWSPEDWKNYFMWRMRKELSVGQRFMPLPESDGGGVIPADSHSSELSKKEFTLLIDIIKNFAEQFDIDTNKKFKRGEIKKAIT